jgi:hypothetical protein
MPCTNTQVKPYWQTGLEVRMFHSNQHLGIAVLITVTLLLMATHALGLKLDGDSYFGTSDNTVTVTVNGTLDVQGTLPNDTETLCLVSFSRVTNRVIQGSDGDANCDYTNLTMSELQKNWHFILVTLTSDSRESSAKNLTDMDITTTSILLPTVAIQPDEFYEIALYDRRHVQIRWEPGKNRIVVQGAEDIGNSSDTVKVKLTKVRIDGLFSRTTFL